MKMNRILSAALLAAFLPALLEGVEPVPSAKPALKLSPEEILETKTTDLGDRNLVIRKIAPRELPPPPEPLPPPDPLDPAVKARIQALREKNPAASYVLVGATVYRSSAFPDGARSRVSLWDLEKRSSVTCWSSADWSLLEGTGGFVDGSGRKYNLLMAHSTMDLDRWAEFVARRGGEYRPPVIPAIPAGPATYVITEGEASGETTTALRGLHDFYNAEKAVLTASHAAREIDRRRREAELKANPPVPKDIILTFWDMPPGRPVAKKGGTK